MNKDNYFRGRLGDKSSALRSLSAVWFPGQTMAESFLFSIAESLISKLASRAYEDASRVLGLHNYLRDLKQTLSLVKAVLLDADSKQDQNYELREWLSQIKLVFYDAEILLDEFECETLRKQVLKAHGATKDKVSHFFSSSNPLVFRYKMAQQIKDVSKRLDKVAADRHKFGLQIIEVDRRVVQRREMTHSHVTDSDVIGRKHDKEEIIQLLMRQNPNDDDHKSLSVIVGFFKEIYEVLKDNILWIVEAYFHCIAVA